MRQHGRGQQRQSVHALADLGLVSAAIIHEVKNSLQGVANALFLLENDSSLTSTAHNQVVIARRELSRASAVATQTLALIREGRRAAVSVTDLLEAVLETYAGKIVHEHITVERRYQFTATIDGNADAIRQVFSNIVLNALESAPSDSGKLTIHTRSIPQSRGGDSPGVEVRFADNGPGIPDEYRSRVFEPLFSTKTGKGSGLGLWVAQQGLTASLPTEPVALCYRLRGDEKLHHKGHEGNTKVRR